MSLETLVYVGCCNRPTSYFKAHHGRGIACFSWEAETETLRHLHTTLGIENPTFLSVDEQHGWLTVNSEVQEWQEGLVSAFAIDPVAGQLRYINQQPSRGSITAQHSRTADGSHLLVANYGITPDHHQPNASVAVLPIAANGELGPACCEHQHQGQGTLMPRQSCPHAHCVRLSVDGGYAMVADLGLDQLMVYRWDQGQLFAHGQVQLPAGSGPRHFVQDPRNGRIYVGNELANSVSVLSWDATCGQARLLGTVEALDPADKAQSHCSEIVLSPNGRHLILGHRGHDSLGVYAVEDGALLRRIGLFATGGACPRHFVFTPDGAHILVANQDSDTLCALRYDADSGELGPARMLAETGSPCCLAVYRPGSPLRS